MSEIGARVGLSTLRVAPLNARGAYAFQVRTVFSVPGVARKAKIFVEFAGQVNSPLMSP